MSKKQAFLKSFGYAGNGIKAAFQNEPNFRIHTAVTVLVLFLAFFLHFSALKFAVLILTICLVITSELVNTLIEKIVDIISPDYSDKAKVIKDISAAAVLICAFSAVLVGLLLFLPM